MKTPAKYAFPALIILLFDLSTASALDALNGVANVYHPSRSGPIRSETLTGQLDPNTFSMTADAWNFAGSPIISNIELLPPGTYTRSGGDFSASDTVTVGSNQLGAFIIYSNGTTNWPGFQVWDVTPDASGLTATYTVVDSDNDGSPGHAFWTSPFPSLSFAYNFDSSIISPAIDVTIGVTGGTPQECTEPGGNTVSLTANIQTVAGAALSQVSWKVDGNTAGTGNSISPFLSLGTHTVEATAVSTSGLTDTDVVSIDIQDTSNPLLNIQFLDAASGQVITSIPGSVQLSTVKVMLNATDICDPAPMAMGFADPVFKILDGTMFDVQASQQKVDMPVSAVSVTATATDASGNKKTDTAVLSVGP